VDLYSAYRRIAKVPSTLG